MLTQSTESNMYGNLLPKGWFLKNGPQTNSFPEKGTFGLGKKPAFPFNFFVYV